MRLTYLFVLVLGAVLVTSGCGGVAGGGTSKSSSGSQTVSVFVTDAPADSVGAFRVDVTSVALQTADGTSSTLLSGSGHTFELRHLQLAPTLAATASVPASAYTKLLITFSNPRMQTVSASGQVLNITASSSPSVSLKTSSVSIPLGFQLPTGSQAALMIDVDLGKSLNTDASGNFVFDPVVTASQVTDNDSKVQLMGAVGSISNISSGAFDLKMTDTGITVHIITDSGTQFDSSVGSFASLQSGANLRVDAKYRSDGSYTAKFVNQGPPNLTNRQNGIVSQSASSNGTGGWGSNVVSQN